MEKKALITGITGQDGSYLTEFLLEKGYKVFGIVQNYKNLGLIEKIKNKIFLFEGNLLDSESLNHAIQKIKPDEVYHLAGISSVGRSWQDPILTNNVNVMGTIRLLEALRRFQINSKIFNASSSEMFGYDDKIIDEASKFDPKNPYAISKCHAHWTSSVYRKSYKMFICNGIMFNHESPRRGDSFVTKKIAKGVVKIKNGTQKCLYLGNLDAKRDWGFAPDYVEAMWLMLQGKKPDDYVIATGKIHSVREFLEKMFLLSGINIKTNKLLGTEEQYIRTDNNETVVKITKDFFRPIDSPPLIGNNNKARKILGWKPRKDFDDIIRIMLDNEYINYKQSIKL